MVLSQGPGWSIYKVKTNAVVGHFLLSGPRVGDSKCFQFRINCIIQCNLMRVPKIALVMSILFDDGYKIRFNLIYHTLCWANILKMLFFNTNFNGLDTFRLLRHVHRLLEKINHYGKRFICYFIH